MYLNGFAVSRNIPTAINYLQLASDRAVTKAVYMLGLCHLFGKHEQASIVVAKELFEKAANAGDESALKILKTLTK